MESQKSRIAGSVEGSSSTPERLPMKRAGFGETGKREVLLTNYFKVLMNNRSKKTDDAYFYLYDVPPESFSLLLKTQQINVV